MAVRDWGDDVMVYSPLSGDTHILDLVSGEVIRALLQAPRSFATLCMRVADLLQIDDDAQTAENLRAVLAHLDEIGLIEPDPGC